MPETDPRLTAAKVSTGRRVSAAKPGSDPISRPARIWSGQDGNSCEARFIRQLRADLIRHVGGQPSATQRIAIERAVMLAYHLGQMDTKAIAAGEMSDHARKQYLAWDGSLRRALLGLGMKTAPSPKMSVPEFLAARDAAKASRT